MNNLIEFKFLSYIDWYDGPLLSLGIGENDEYVFEVWCDCNKENNYNLYAHVFIEKLIFEKFLKKEISYFEALSTSNKIITFKYNNLVFDIEKCNKEDFMSLYGPRDSSFHWDKEIDDYNIKLTQFLNGEKNECF